MASDPAASPLSPPAAGPPRELPRCIGFWGGSAIMVGIIIGGGIFQTPPDIARQMGSPALILLLWVAGGVISLFGALAYAELATLFPRSGGIYVFLREGFGPQVAFVFGWTNMLISKPFAAGGIAIVFADHLNQLLGTHWDGRVLTCALLIVLTIINTFGVRLGTGIAAVLTSLKILALIAIVILGLILMKGSAANLAAVPAPQPFWLALAPVMVAILWTYDGWSDLGALAGEVRNPQKSLPRIFFMGTAIITVVYAAVNAIYMWMVPLSEMAGPNVKTIAPLVMQRLLGEAGGVAVTLIVVLSTLGSTHGSIITGARITFAQARDGLLFRFLGHIHPKYATPAVSLWFQLTLSCIAVWIAGNFQNLVDAFVFTMWIFYALAVASVIVLRIRRPDLPRPYKCWGYPVVPILFILSAALVTVLSLIGPFEENKFKWYWLGILIAGLPTYYIWTYFAKPRPMLDEPTSGSMQ